MNKEKIVALIEKRIVFHNKHFNRYRKEVDAVIEMRYISKRNLSQKKYSDERSGRELAIMDELELIKDAILGESVQ